MVLVPFWAVTTVVIVFTPTFKGMPATVVPDATGTPFTIIVAVLSLATGVTAMALTAVATLAV